MDSKIINLTEKTRIALDFAIDEEITEDKLEERCKWMNEISLEITRLDVDISRKDIKELEKYLDSNIVNVYVDNKKIIFDKAYIDFIERYPSTNMRLAIDVFDRIKDVANLKDKNVTLLFAQKELETVNVKNLNEYMERYNVDEISVSLQEKCLRKEEKELLDKLQNLDKKIDISRNFDANGEYYFPEHYEYNNYKDIEKGIQELLKGINENDSQAEKFFEIYKRLAYNIEYDNEATEDGTKYAEENFSKCRNLENGILKGKCVCAGYAEILSECLNRLGVKNNYIHGETSNEHHSKHAWNQVEIDGIWYNTDLTWDRENIFNGCMPNYCLLSDEEFIDHYSEFESRKKCEKCYDQKEIYDRYHVEGFKIPNKKYSPKKLLKLIDEVKDNSKDGVRIGVNYDIDEKNYNLHVGKLFNESVIWPEKDIDFSKSEMLKFTKDYIKKYKIDKVDNKIFYKTKDNLQMVIFEDIKDELKEQGFDIENEIQGKSYSQPVNKDKQLAVYKENIIQKMRRFLWNRMKKPVQEQEVEEKLEIKPIERKKTKSWDLDNYDIGKIAVERRCQEVIIKNQQRLEEERRLQNEMQR